MSPLGPPPKPRSARKVWGLLLVPILAVAGATGLRLALAPASESQAPLLLYTLAVLTSGWWGGLLSGLAATVLAAAVGNYFFLEPTGSFLIADPAERLRVALFVGVGALASLFAESMHRANRRSEARRGQLAVTLASIGDAVIATDQTRRVTFVNPEAERLTGWPMADAEGRDLGELFRIVNESTREPVACPVQKVLDTGHVVGLANHTILIARDGTERPIDDSAAPIRDEAGETRGAVLIFRDITDKHEAARRLRESEAKHRAILESIADGFFAVDAAWRFTYVNGAAYRILGRSPGDLAGKNLWAEFPGQIGTEFEAMHRRVAAGGSAESLTAYYPEHDRWYEVHTFPAEDGVTIFFRDVSDRKRAEDEVRASEAQRRLALDSAELGAWHVDPATMAMTGDERFRAIFGLGDSAGYEEAVARIHPDDRERVREEVAGATRPDDPEPYAVEYRVARPDGSVRWVFAKGRANLADDGSGRRVVSFDGTVADITPRKDAEEALRLSEERFAFVRQSSGVGFWYCDLPFDVLEWDERVKAHFHLPPDAPVTIDTFYDRIHPDDRDPTRRAIAASIAGRTAYDVDYRTVDPATGAENWVQAVGRTSYAPDGTPIRFDGVTIDVTPRKRAEQNLRVSEDRFRTLFDSIDEGFCVIEVLFDGAGRPDDYRFVEANPAFEKHTGLVEAVGRSIREMVPDLDRFWFETYGRVALTGEPERFASEAEAMGRWFDVYAFRIGAAEQRRVAVLFNDISDRKRAEAERDRLTAQRQVALDAARLGWWHYDPATHAASYDGRYREIFGVEGTGRPNAEIMPLIDPADLPAVWAAVEAALDPADPKPYEVEYRVNRADGVQVWVEARGLAAFTGDGPDRRAESFVGTVADVTDRKRAEDAMRRANDELERRVAERTAELQREQGFLKTVLESVEDAVVACDPDGVLTLFNRATRALHGLPEEPIPPERWAEHYDLYRPDGRTPFLKEEVPLFRALAGEHVRDAEMVVARKGDEPRLLLASGQPLFDEAGRKLGAVVSMHDVTDRRRAEEARAELARQSELRRSEERFRQFADAAPAMLWVTDPDARCTFLSRGWYEFTGQTEAEALGLGWLDAVHSDDREAAGRAFLAANGRREPFALEHRLRRGDGASHWVIDAGRPRFSPEGHFLGYVGSVIDISDRRRAEEEIRSKTERLNLLVENIKDYAVVIAGPDGTVIEWQGGAERITGFRPEEAVGGPAHLLFTPEDRAAGRPEEEMTKAARDGRAEDKRWHIRKDGSRFFADGVMTALFDEAGRLRGFGKVFKDATGERKLDENRRLHTEQLRTLADVSSRLNAVLDLRSVLGVVTEEGRTLIGAHQASTCLSAAAGEPEQTVSFSGGLRGSSPPSEFDRALIDEAVASGTKAVRLTQGELEDLPGWASSGSGPRLRGLLAAPIVGRGGESLGVIHLSDKFSGDFTEEDEALLVQLAQMAAVAVENTGLYQALRDADRRKDEFLAMLAHELRNPLAPIRNALGVLERKGSRDEAEVRLRDMIDRQVTHLTRLVDDLLDVARITSGKVALKREPVELARVLSQAVETSRPLIEARRHRLAIDTPDAPVWLDADAVRVAQVVSNLLNNAAKYTDEGGQIGLSAAVEGPGVTIRVTDSGIGLSREMLPRVFDLFTQVSAGIARTAGGLGVGLTLVRKLVEMHGGSVAVSSAGLGQGSEFTVRLPVTAAPTGEHVPAPDVFAPHAPKRVLVVDDNLDSLSSMAELLSLDGHVVETASDGIRAVEVARAFRPEVMFLDLGLPGRDGYEVAKMLRVDFPTGVLRLIALSGYGQEEDKKRTREVGFDDHLVKPVDPDTVERAMKGG